MLMSRYVTQGFEVSFRMSGVILILAGAGKDVEPEAMLLLEPILVDIFIYQLYPLYDSVPMTSNKVADS